MRIRGHHRRLHRRLRMGAVAMAVSLSSSCQAVSFDHGDPNTGSGTDSGPVTDGLTISAGGADGTPDLSPNVDGNYPDPAVTRCGDVLGELPPIGGLASAWAVVAVPGATVDGAPLEAGSVLLRLSQEALIDCGDAPGSADLFGSTGFPDAASTSGGGPDGNGDRGFELMLAPTEFELGVHSVATLADPRLSISGNGAASESATIELLRVDDDCVIGIVRGFVTDSDEPFLEGGFVAQTCQRQCVPSQGVGC